MDRSVTPEYSRTLDAETRASELRRAEDEVVDRLLVGHAQLRVRLAGELDAMQIELHALAKQARELTSRMDFMGTRLVAMTDKLRGDI